MDKKKILIVGRAFYPMNSPRSFRTTELVKEFSRQGHDVTLVTVKNNKEHPAFEKEFNVTINDFGKLNFKEIDIRKGSALAIKLKRILRRGLGLYLEFPHIELMFLTKKILSRHADYDLLITIATPHPIHWGAAWARSPQHPIAKTWVADCGDPYMGSNMDTFRKRFYFKYFEKWFCRKADYITVPFEGAKDAYYQEFRDKIKVIPQGFNFDEIKIDKIQYTPNKVPTFAFAGGLIPGGRDPRLFLDYILSLNIPFKLTFYTKQVAMVAPYAKRSNGQIEIRDYVPREELLQTLSKVDFLLNINNSNATQLPSKLIDYYLIGRPVLNISSDEFDKEAVKQFLGGNYSAQLQYNNVEQYNIKNVCNSFLNLMK